MQNSLFWGHCELKSHPNDPIWNKKLQNYYLLWRYLHIWIFIHFSFSVRAFNSWNAPNVHLGISMAGHHLKFFLKKMDNNFFFDLEVLKSALFGSFIKTWKDIHLVFCSYRNLSNSKLRKFTLFQIHSKVGSIKKWLHIFFGEKTFL